MPLSTTSRTQNHEFAGKVAFITGAPPRRTGWVAIDLLQTGCMAAPVS